MGITLVSPTTCAGVFEFAPALPAPSRGWTKDKAQVALDVCRTMVQLHEAKLVHGYMVRRLRLNNVYRHPHSKAMLLSYPQVSPVADTPMPWAAPELEAATISTPEMDVFAFGMFLLELDLGHVPFANEVAITAAEGGVLKSWNVEGAVATAVTAECLLDITALIQKCLSVAPSQRPTSLMVHDLLRDIKNVMEHCLSRRSTHFHSTSTLISDVPWFLWRVVARFLTDVKTSMECIHHHLFGPWRRSRWK
ncbi:hypothetical protein H310_13376 [Aphanomyces invadans]|uniref:Protein kinase domain-containing protein n=1 Tax=Aphanomyces invadans TaxID=157072 RepID=A0A024TG55_9STRA|nr:hypothetical protein H310_13376 [Aphanomyces invadans]ETV92322.1 hypothetical protein H310_13376 [Aphanomyces invadans]|eukprot:XP_008879073.1 hypothetical protein H310_13376 [Aphanomyces invadans]